MYSDPGVGHTRTRELVRFDSCVGSQSTGTTNKDEQFSPRHVAYSEGEWNPDDTDNGGASQDWELRSTVAKLKKMSLRTFRLWR